MVLPCAQRPAETVGGDLAPGADGTGFACLVDFGGRRTDGKEDVGIQLAAAG
jgi:hypothetical protein